MKTDKILILDVETTGYSATKDKIVELGMVELDIKTGEKEIIFDMVFNPGIPKEEIENAWIVTEGYMTTEEILVGEDIRNHALDIQGIIDSYRNGSTAFNNVFDFKFMESVGFFFHKKLPCPMKISKPIVDARNKNNKIKNPSAEEAYNFFFPGEEYVELHRGADDSLHEGGVVFELIKRGVFLLN